MNNQKFIQKVIAKLEKEDLPYTRSEYHDYHFETGIPVKFPFLHKPGASKGYSGDKKRFQQDIEPSGKYVILDVVGSTEGYESGEATLKNPLVLKWGNRYDDSSWKSKLFEKYNKKGKSLTQALIKEGYDGVITIDGKYGPSEIVLFNQ